MWCCAERRRASAALVDHPVVQVVELPQVGLGRRGVAAELHPHLSQFPREGLRAVVHRTDGVLPNVEVDIDYAIDLSLLPVYFPGSR